MTYDAFHNATIWPSAATPMAKNTSIRSRQGTSLGGPSGRAGRAPIQPHRIVTAIAAPARIALAMRLTALKSISATPNPSLFPCEEL